MNVIEMNSPITSMHNCVVAKGFLVPFPRKLNNVINALLMALVMHLFAWSDAFRPPRLVK